MAGDSRKAPNDWLKVDKDTSTVTIKFHHGQYDPAVGPNGLNYPDLLDFAIDFLTNLDGKRGDSANDVTIRLLKEAADVQRSRLRDRVLKGIVGRRDK